MTKNRVEHIHEFRVKVKAANKEATKKELFKDLLNRLFASNEETKEIIDAISSGAEAAVINIPRKDKRRRGSADTLYNKIIIEFENDLKKSLPHAKEQLAGYLLGQFNSGEGYSYTLIASDFINWKVFAPDVSCLDRLETMNEDELILNEIVSAVFTLTEQNAEDFYYWIDRFLFKEEKQKATLKRIEESFGYQSPIFVQCFREMGKTFRAVKDTGEVQVSFEQWKKFLSIAYGSFVPSDQNFLIHTYLSIFAKMLAYTVVSNDDYIDDAEMREIIEGSIFHRFNIANFVENDFFYWVIGNDSFPTLKKSFRFIAQELSRFDFFNVDEDILKGVYQEMIDLDTRHALGEYYTPDWLCERIVQKFGFKPTDKVLDPACGSGSFLRAVIDQIRTRHPDADIERVNDQLYGIDIHPLSVQIAKTTLLLALGPDVVNWKTPVHLNIILANTLLAPKGVQDLYANIFRMEIDENNYELDTAIFQDVRLFDEALSVCEELAEQTKGLQKVKLSAFKNSMRQQSHGIELTDNVVQSFYQIYLGFKKVKEQGRDSIWQFIVQNLYKPYFLSESFDYVIGNPPWFTYSSIRNARYQNLLNQLAAEYEVKPERQANFPHLEIAAIFLAYCSSYFLRPAGAIAFVLPRSFFSADHHDNSRSGKAKGFRLTEAWDLNDVTPLFRIPSCVLFGKKSEGHDQITSTLPGREFEGRLQVHNCNLQTAQSKLVEKNVTWFYVTQGGSSALSKRRPTGDNHPNPYRNAFKQGATIVPRSLYFVDIAQPAPPDFEGRILNVRTSPEIQAGAKRPWTGIEIKGRIESRFLFRTALAKSVLPFALFNPAFVVLPITIEQNRAGGKAITLHSAEQLRGDGFLNAARWFKEAENKWQANRTEKSKRMTNLDRLNFQHGLTEQNLNAPFLVLYNSSAQDANATVVRRTDFDLEFIVDHKAYVLTTDLPEEAYFLTAVLNSTVPNEMMKDFQSRGLFGARDIHKKILDIYFPRFNRGEKAHLDLASWSEKAHQKVKDFLGAHPPEGALTPRRLGRLRSEVKQHLEREMKEIDGLVERVMA